MNVLVKKEIRLLRPVWLAVLILEVALPWMCPDREEVIGLAPVAFFFGMVLLAIEPFGREFSLGTFASLMAQPMARRQVWQTKITVLFSAAALIFAAYLVSCELRLHLDVTAQHAGWWRESSFPGFPQAMLASAAVLCLALVGGLWTVLLLRQIASAFWITFLAPVGFLVTVTLCLPDKYVDNNHVMVPLVYGLGALYTVAGFWLARRLFHRAQDAAWTGGVISFSSWRYFSPAARGDVSTRRWQPLTALLKKEFQVHSLSLFCAGSLLVLQLAIFLLRITYANFHKYSVAEVISDLFWTLWLVMPLILGGTAVAEERKLGMMESQFCLPTSRRQQFALKFIPVMIFGTLLGGVVPMLLESLAAWLNAPCDAFAEHHFHAGQFGGGPDVIQFELRIVALAAGLSWVSFFASTLARNFLQALSITLVTLVGWFLLISLLQDDSGQRVWILGIVPWPSLPLILLGVPTLLVTLMWLVYGNFNWFHEPRRLWRRNTRGVLAACLFVLGSSALLYNRAWEVFEPAEPAHGPAQFSLANRPALHGDFANGLLVQLPDGRMWFDHLSYSFLTDSQPSHWRVFWRMLADPRPASAGPQQFLAGSNWISATAMRVDPTWSSRMLGGSGRAFGYLDTVGIRANGTLWISSQSVPNVWTGEEMTQFGNETNWQQVIRQAGNTFVLLKNDGTLWRWGTNRLDWNGWPTHWPTVRNSPVRQIGTNSDWQEIFDGWLANARRTDGSTWAVGLDFKTGQDRVERQTNFDAVPFHTFAWKSQNVTAYVAADGTLWISDRHASEDGPTWAGTGFLQVGRDTNWAAVAVPWPSLVALKTDGSLWQWKSLQKSTAEFSQTPPARVGIHSDWLALTDVGSGVVTLAADGGLWLWTEGNFYNDAPISLLRLPKQPEFLGNVFSESKSRRPGQQSQMEVAPKPWVVMQIRKNG